MPTQRKRIGFLPRSEVQNIIDKICNHNKLSQSKVTGILVEEALSSRGILNTSVESLSFDFNGNKENGLLTSNDTFDSEQINYGDNFNLDKVSINDEVAMINDFIEFKFFKNIMNRNKKKS
tara:strand:+ start:101 stop:463 length:363 start_codon:yes stop_codon:yes gene_type:complete